MQIQSSYKPFSQAIQNQKQDAAFVPKSIPGESTWDRNIDTFTDSTLIGLTLGGGITAAATIIHGLGVGIDPLAVGVLTALGATAGGIGGAVVGAVRVGLDTFS